MSVNNHFQFTFVLDRQKDSLSFGMAAEGMGLPEEMQADILGGNKSGENVETRIPGVTASLPADKTKLIRGEELSSVQGLKLTQQNICIFRRELLSLNHYEGFEVEEVSGAQKGKDDFCKLVVRVEESMLPAFGVLQATVLQKSLPTLVPQNQNVDLSDPVVSASLEQLRLKEECQLEELDLELLEELNDDLAEHLDLKPIDLLLEEFTSFDEMLEISDEGLKARREYFRRLPHDRLREVLQVVSKIHLSDEQIKALKELDFSHPIFKESEWPDYVLKAVFVGKLTPMQASSLLLYDRCEQNDEGQTEVFRLPEDKAVEMLEKAFAPFWKPDMTATLRTALSKLPPEEGVFYSTKLANFNRTNPQQKPRELRETFMHTRNYPLCLVEGPNGSTYQVVIPPKLLWEILKVWFPEHAKMPNPVLGPSIGAKNFTYPHQRDVYIPCRYFSEPTEADMNPCDGLAFYHHDAIYHLPLDSSNPHVAAFIELASLFDTDANKTTRNALLDREIRLYLHPEAQQHTVGRVLEDEELFWLALAFMYHRIEMDPTSKVGEEEQLLPTAIAHIKSNAERWKETYDLSLDDLSTLLNMSPGAPAYQDLHLLFSKYSGS